MINFEKELDEAWINQWELPENRSFESMLWDNLMKLMPSIAARVERETIERGTLAQNNGWKVSSLTLLYSPAPSDAAKEHSELCEMNAFICICDDAEKGNQ